MRWPPTTGPTCFRQSCGPARPSLQNAIVFSAGCHAGYNIVNGDVVPNVTQPLDWVQAFAQKKATLIAGTGYQYGDTDFLAHSERIYARFAEQLGGAVGKSLLRSKQLFLEESPASRPSTRKLFWRRRSSGFRCST